MCCLALFYAFTNNFDVEDERCIRDYIIIKSAHPTKSILMILLVKLQSVFRDILSWQIYVVKYSKAKKQVIAKHVGEGKTQSN